jgi:Pyridoxamine 5'-phosphate oxidase
MATWATFTSEAPELAAVAEMLWPGIVQLERDRGGAASAGPVFSVAFLATSSPDGRPRLHPFCPVLAGGRLFAAIPRPSPKGHDLRRDPRCAIHALPGPDDDELYLRCRAREVTQDDTRSMVGGVVRRSEVGGMIRSVTRDPLFEFDLERVDVAKWLDIGRATTRAVRTHWQADRSGHDAGQMGRW